MKWFGRKSVREGARPALSRAGSFAGAIGEWPRSYEAQVREAYCHNPVAQRAVKLVAEGAGSAALKASDPALLALVTARSGGQPLIETLAAHILLHGRRSCGSTCSPRRARWRSAPRRPPQTPCREPAGSSAGYRRVTGQGAVAKSQAGPRAAGGSWHRSRGCASGWARLADTRFSPAGNGVPERSMAECWWKAGR